VKTLSNSWIRLEDHHPNEKGPECGHKVDDSGVSPGSILLSSGGRRKG
jgi:hypothetical protein